MQTFIVTGGNRGIGSASVEVLVKLGHRVLLVSRSVANGEIAKAILGKEWRKKEEN